MKFKEAREKIKQSSLLTMLPFKEDLLEDYEFYLEGLIVKGVNKDKIKEGNQLYFVFAQFKSKELDFLLKINSHINNRVDKVSSGEFETILLKLKIKLKEEIKNNFNTFLKFKFKKKEITDPITQLEFFSEFSELTEFKQSINILSNSELHCFKESILLDKPNKDLLEKLEFKEHLDSIKGVSSKAKKEYKIVTYLKKDGKGLKGFIIYREDVSNSFLSLVPEDYINLPTKGKEKIKNKIVIKELPFEITNINLNSPIVFENKDLNSLIILSKFDIIYIDNLLDKIDFSLLMFGESHLLIPYKNNSVGLIPIKVGDSKDIIINKLKKDDFENLFVYLGDLKNISKIKDDKFYIEFTDSNFFKFESLRTFSNHQEDIGDIFIGDKNGIITFYGLYYDRTAFFEYKWIEKHGKKQSEIPFKNIKEIKAHSMGAIFGNRRMITIIYTDENIVYLTEQFKTKEIWYLKVRPKDSN